MEEKDVRPQAEVVADRYELEELVGTGGMSTVYCARDRLLDRRVALKILHDHYAADEEFVERFRREARSVAQLSHPNIVGVIDRGEDGGRQFIVFEFVDGENLGELIRREGPLPVRRALEIALEVARGLSFAHKQGLVHRDVKPQNVLLNDEGGVKVTDFGIARSLDVAGMTQTGTVLGTSNYIAPEQAGGKPVSAQTDVYSFGILLYELLAGEVPFPGENFVAVAMKHVHEPPPSILDRRPDVPLRLDRAIDRALAKDPAARFESMEELCRELQACLDDLGGEQDADATMIAPAAAAQRPRRRATAPSGRSRLPLLLAAVALVAVVAGVIGVLALRGGGSASGSGASGGKPVALHAVASLDPFGDKSEHPEAVGRATDGDPSTFWYTEKYYDGNLGGKPGVGLVVDAGRAVELHRIVVTTDTPGFTAGIRVGNRWASPPRTAGATTVFPISGPAARRYVVWITKLAGQFAHVNEVRTN